MWFVYALGCQGGGIYIGITKDIPARIDLHIKGKGSLYTKLNKPLRIHAVQVVDTYAEAHQIERRLKSNQDVKSAWLAEYYLEEDDMHQ